MFWPILKPKKLLRRLFKQKTGKPTEFAYAAQEMSTTASVVHNGEHCTTDTSTDQLKTVKPAEILSEQQREYYYDDGISKEPISSLTDNVSSTVENGEQNGQNLVGGETTEASQLDHRDSSGGEWYHSGPEEGELDESKLLSDMTRVYNSQIMTFKLPLPLNRPDYLHEPPSLMYKETKSYRLRRIAGNMKKAAMTVSETVADRSLWLLSTSFQSR